jgi:hypothetical protein
MLVCCKGRQSLFNQPPSDDSAEPERGQGEGDDSTFLVPDVVCGVALDPWMRPILEDAPNRCVVKPLLIINRWDHASSLVEIFISSSRALTRAGGGGGESSDLWQSKSGDLAKQAALVQRRSDDAVVYVVTAKGTSHENFTDFPWLFSTRLPGRPILLPQSWMTVGSLAAVRPPPKC